MKNFKLLSPKISLDGVLLFALAVPFIMKYRLSSGETPYALFTVIFLVLISYFFVQKEKVKTALVWLVILLTVGTGLVASIAVRHQVAPVYGVHDIILQLEAAIRYLVNGTNPYAATYFGTPLEDWHYSETEVNPALFHFVMPPFYLLFSLPFYGVSNILFGFFDGRLPLVFAFFGTLTILTLWVKPHVRPLALLLFAYNPGTLDYFMEGRSDFVMHVFLLWSLFMLYKKRYMLSALVLALAFGVKQSIWPFFPLYWFYMYHQKKSAVLSSLIGFSIVFFILTVPFLLWDAQAFIDSTVLYLSASGQENYPISGYGFGMLMKEAGVITDIHGHFPFYLFQAGIGLPVLGLLLIWLREKPTLQNLLFAFGIFLLVFWYFSRYFNNSHIGYISCILLTSYFLPSREHEKTKP